MWIFAQDSGSISRNNVIHGYGYSGHEKGKNNPDMQNIFGIGPLPCGLYTIEEPITHPRLGPFALQLLPDPNNQMFGRSDFWIHGDSADPEDVGEASHGCIVTNRMTRQTIWGSGDTLLKVISTMQTADSIWPNS